MYIWAACLDTWLVGWLVDESLFGCKVLILFEQELVLNGFSGKLCLSE